MIEKKMNSFVSRYKRSDDRYLAGVCGGIAEYHKISPWVVRILWTVLTLLSIMIPGLIIYIIFWSGMQPPNE